MSLLSDNRHWLLFAAVVLTTLGVVGLPIVGVITTVAILLGGGPLLPVVAGTILGTLVLVGLDILFAVALARELTRMASLPKSQRVTRLLRTFERIVPPLSSVGLADRFEPPEPTIEERREKLTQRYVDGDLSEGELERELDRLLDEDEAEQDRPSPDRIVDAADAANREQTPEAETTDEADLSRNS